MSKEALNKTIEAAPSIIREAAAKPLGIVALLVLVFTVLALVFFRGEGTEVRVAMFLLLLASAAALVVVVIRVAHESPTVQQEVAPRRVKQPDTTSKPATETRKVATIRVVAESDVRSDVDGIVIEEDTYLVLGAKPEAKELHVNPRRIARELDDTFPKKPGSVIVRDSVQPIEFLAVVHDLERDPSWTEEWVAVALEKIVREARDREIRSIRLPILAGNHGSLTSERFSRLLARALEEHAAVSLRIDLMTSNKGKPDDWAPLKEWLSTSIAQT